MLPIIHLVKMTPEAFATWHAAQIKSYAQEKITAMTWRPEEAAQKAAEEFKRLLPDGQNTAHEWLWTITQDQTPIGALWVHHDVDNAHAFIYDIVIAPAYQDQGFGQQTLQALDEKAKAAGVTTIGLHVFGGNHRAQHVYAKMGFVTTDINMLKTL